MQTVIIGGGAIGNFLALKLTEKKIKPIVIEEHEKIGEPIHCTGLISKNIDNLIDIPKRLIKNKIRGARFFSKNSSFELDIKKTTAYVLDRSGYDSYLYERAVKKGAEFILSTKFLEFKRNEKNLDIFTNNGNFKADILVSAEGPLSKIGSSIGVKNNCIIGFQYVCELDEEKDKDFVELYFSEFSDNFFAWIVPEGDGIYRAGLASSMPGRDMEKFRKKIGIKKILSKQAGLIPIGFQKKTSDDNIILSGDSASHVKATTGGGVVFGSLCAEVCADAISSTETKNDFSREFFKKNYDEVWQKKYGAELKKHLFLRETANILKSEDYDYLFGLLNENKDAFLKSGDMEFVSPLFSELMKNPKLISFFIKKSPKIIANLKSLI